MLQNRIFKLLAIFTNKMSPKQKQEQYTKLFGYDEGKAANLKKWTKDITHWFKQNYNRIKNLTKYLKLIPK